MTPLWGFRKGDEARPHGLQPGSYASIELLGGTTVVWTLLPNGNIATTFSTSLGYRGIDDGQHEANSTDAYIYKAKLEAIRRADRLPAPVPVTS